MSFKNCYKNKVVLVTGHTGFKGSWLCAWLIKMGAIVVGVSMNIPTKPSHYYKIKLSEQIKEYKIDILEHKKIKKIIKSVKPSFVFHLAAQPIVSASYKDPLNTWHTNLIGTLNILDSIKDLKNKCSAVFITSDKCYENLEWVWGYKETDRLGGVDPYSASKASAEIAIRSFNKSFLSNNKNIRIASARAGNVIGGGDWANDRIITDCVKSWSKNKTVKLRNPKSTRPWQHVLEPLSGYLCLGMHLNNNFKFSGESYNFGPGNDKNYSVLELVKQMSTYWQKVKWKIEKNTKVKIKESGLLSLNCDKVLSHLNWRSALTFDQTVKFTAKWYKKYYEKNNDTLTLTYNQIDQYIKIAKKNKLPWSK